MKAWSFDQNLNTLIQTGEVTSEERSATELGLDRERNGKIQWLSWGPNHPDLIARRRSRPKKVKPAWEQEQEREWDEATAKTAPIALSDRPDDQRRGASAGDSTTARPSAAPKSA
jgi:hypothetical protein